MPRRNVGSSKKMTMKQVDKMMKATIARMRKGHMIMKRQKAGAAKAKAAGRAISPLQPEPWITSVVSFLIYALPSGGSGKVKKTLLRLLKEYHSPEEWNEVELLLETFDASMARDRFKPMMEMVEIETIEPEFWVSIESVMLEMIDYSDQLHIPNSQKKLTVSILNEEVRQLKKGVKKVASSSDKGDKDAQIKMFFNLYSKFLEKLKIYQITSPDRIEAFLLDMVEMVNRIRVKRRETVAAKPKPVKENKSPVGMTLASLMEMDDANLDFVGGPVAST